MPFLFVLPFMGAVALVALVSRANSSKASKRATPTHQFELDRGMPDDVVRAVLSALVDEAEPLKLEALAHSLEAKYPLAAGELRAKASMLIGASSSPSTTGTSLPRASSPDRSEVAVTLQAAMRAYAQETDPVELQGFAVSLRDRFPTASLLLAAKAHELSAAAASPSSTFYEVRAGDNPVHIAEALTGDGRRWPELVEANPGKPRTKDGSFASLEPGEKLLLPASWAAHAAHASTSAHPAATSLSPSHAPEAAHA